MIDASMNNERHEELQSKLDFTVQKFEEQNKKFQECGQELAEAYETIEQQEQIIIKLKQDVKIMTDEITELKAGIASIAIDGTENSHLLSDINA